MPKPLKRLELRLPVNHPVWSLPEGSRSRIVREWLEVGRRLTEIEESLEIIKKKLNYTAHSSRIDEIKPSAEIKQTDHQSGVGFDKNAFLDNFK